MNRDDIIRMAREAYGVDPWWLPKTETEWLMLERFALLVEDDFRKRLADNIEAMPFGDTASSFASFIRGFE